MQIRNEYTSFNSKKYNDHTHHITKCLHEEQTPKTREAAGAGVGKEVSGGKGVEFSKDGDTYRMSAPYAAKKKDAGGGKSLLKGFWDALGEEGQTEEKGRNIMASFKDHLLSGIYGAAAAFKNSFIQRIERGAKRFQEGLRTGTEGGRRYFKRNRDAFAALTEGRTSSRKEQGSRQGIRTKEMHRQAASGEGQGDIPAKILVNSHLMDSYSKKGEYCQLGENLTYNKSAGNGKERGARE